MNKLILAFSMLMLIGLSGCLGKSQSNTQTANTVNAERAPTPLVSPLANTYANSGISNNPRSGNINVTTGNPGDTSATANSFGNIKATPAPTASSVSPVPSPEKKEEGLFSFPPPRPTSVTEIGKTELPISDGRYTLAEVSDKIAAAMKSAGYRSGKYTFFWNNSDEFAIVTAMERVKPDGGVFYAERWIDSDVLPDAGEGEYFKYLIEGKKVYYRVFAFVFTPKIKKWQHYLRGTPPDFYTALHWIESPSGSDTLSDGNSAVADVKFTNEYKCFELLYLFVNHTSLDAPTAIDLRDDKDERKVKGIIRDLSTDADEHRRKTNIVFGDGR